MKGDGKDKAYYLALLEAALAMAERATNVAAKLIHLDMAGRYSVAAYRQDARLQALGQRP